MTRPKTISTKLLILLAFLLLHPQTYAQVDTQNSTDNQGNASVFVKFNNIPVRDQPTVSGNVIAIYDQFDKIVVSHLADEMFYEVVYPIEGYINRLMVYTEKEMDELYINEINQMNELGLVARGMTPYHDIIKNREGLPAYDLDRKWAFDTINLLKYVAVPLLDVRSGPSKNFKSLGQYRLADKIIIDKNYKSRGGWVKTTFPIEGYARNMDLYTTQEIKIYHENQRDWVNAIGSALGMAPIEEIIYEEEIILPDEKVILPDVEVDLNANKEILISNVIDRDSLILILQDSIRRLEDEMTADVLSLLAEEEKNKEIDQADDADDEEEQETEKVIEEEVPEIQITMPDSSMSIWWTDELDADENDFPESAILNILYDYPDSKEKFIPRLSYRPEDGKNYRPFNLPPPKKIRIGKPAKWLITGDPGMAQGRYNLKLELLDKKTGDVQSTHSYLNREELNLKSFEYLEGKNKLRISILGHVSPLYQPVELIFRRLGFPYGGSVEFSKQKWPVSFGLGVNVMKAETVSKVYHMQSSNLYLFGKYTPLKLFDDRLDLFITAGASSFWSQIMNVKYPTHEDYYPTEASRGFGYTGGAGAVFEFHKFLFGLQYQLYGTPLVIFGAPLNEPETQEGLKDYIPTTQYKLFAGSNQLQVMIGYRIN